MQVLIRPYAGDDLTRLYIRRAKYMAGGDFDALIKQMPSSSRSSASSKA